ncbi:hypothetical protein KI387_005529, partial [Taxus chinensis]
MEQLAVSPLGKILNTPTFGLCVQAVAELDKPVDIPSAKKSIFEILVSQNPRFSSILIMKENGVVQWEKTEVNMDDHVFVPDFPPHLISYDKYVDEYVTDMHSRKLSPSRPLWEFHFLNYKTTNGEATMIMNVHHTLGDGASFVALASACSAIPSHNPTLPQTLIPPSTSQVHKRTLDTTWFGFDGIYRLVNDVVMGVVFYGFRQYCQMELSDPKHIENLRVTAMTLINTRTRRSTKNVKVKPKSKTGVPQGNSFGFLQLKVPMKKLENPLEYVQRAKHMTDKKKISLATLLISKVLTYITLFKGPEASARVMYNTLANTTLSVTNVNGPMEQLIFEGHKVKNCFFSVSGFPQ